MPVGVAPAHSEVDVKRASSSTTGAGMETSEGCGVRVLVWLAVLLINFSIWSFIGLFSGSAPLGFGLTACYLAALLYFLLKLQQTHA